MPFDFFFEFDRKLERMGITFLEVLNYGYHSKRPCCRPYLTCHRRGSHLVRLLLVLLLSTTVFAWAKPMMAPTLESAVQQSATIVEVEYLGYDRGPVSYFSGPVANYRVLRALKGSSPKDLKVRYDFTDGSACLAPKSWSFSDKMMPKPGSRWILLLQTKGSPSTTFRGNFGRIESQSSQSRELQSLIRAE